MIFGIAAPLFARGSVVIHEFPETPYVKMQVEFWEKIFSKYNTDQVLIHDAWNPDIIIDMIDYQVFSAKYNQGKPYRGAEKKHLTAKYLNRYRLALKRFAKEGRNAIRHGSIEKRIYNVYAKNLRALSALYKGKITLRSQTGLKNEFENAAEIAEKYLPYMEKIFIREGVSSDLTRIAFVESMFNIKAKSKVGASGLWQFMPATAKSYLKLNKLVDERHSPLKATVAAARLLKDNFESLESWPMAVTAYNHGRSGMARAQRVLKTKNMDEVIKRYRHRLFGFASRNFYAEFLAARNVYNQLFRHKRQDSKNPLSISMVRLDRPVSLGQIIKHTNLSAATIKKNNPDFNKKAFTRYKNVPLPLNYELIVPYSYENHVKKVLSRLVASKNRRSKKWSRL
jgi:membrane-bound lytic murein transglycosylase D